MSEHVTQIAWETVLDPARRRAGQEGKPVLIDFSGAPTCQGCVAMETVTYSDHRVAGFIERDCVPVKVAVTDEPALVDEYLVTWTPTIVFADERGRAHYRVEGYHPPAEFVARLALATGRFLLNGDRFAEAAVRFEGVSARHPGTAAAAEALYWHGVARFKERHDPAELRPSWDRLAGEFPDSEWALRTRIPGTK
jgi:hypothetical protein